LRSASDGVDEVQGVVMAPAFTLMVASC